MTNREVTGVLAYLQECYPTQLPADPGARAAVWADVLEPFNAAEVMEAARALVRNGHVRPPTPAEIAQQVIVNRDGALPSEVDVWRACTSPTSAAELEAAHPVIRAAVHATGGVGSLSWLDEDGMRRAIRSAYFGAKDRYVQTGSAEAPALDRGRGGEVIPLRESLRQITRSDDEGGAS